MFFGNSSASSILSSVTNNLRLGATLASDRMMTSLAKASSRTLFQEKPTFIYGTAWKKDQTRRLVKEALAAGFTAVDTAAQPRHYQENLVGEGLRDAFRDGIVKREDIYVQTKYTSPDGQDNLNMPYDPLDPIETQIKTSVASSLQNLRPSEDHDEDSYLDCALLHSPLPSLRQTLQAWKALEAYVPHTIHALGISNVTLPTLRAICEEAMVKPSVVQNRFYPATKYDVPLRSFCRENNITYQSFWTLTGNPNLLRSKPVATLAKAANVNGAVALYALVMDLGITVLNGTTSAKHMEEDLIGVAAVREWALNHDNEWQRISSAFERLVDS